MQGTGKPTAYTHDTFVAQGFSKLTEFTVSPVGPDWPQHRSWLTTFTMNSIFTMNLPEPQRAFAFAVLRRAEGAVEHFVAACDELAGLVKEPTVSRYFRALRQVEHAVAQLYQGVEFVRRAAGPDKRLFTTGDGSRYQRLNEVYNVSRHGNPLQLPAGNLQVAWLQNDGVHVATAALGFDELRAIVVELAEIANQLSSGAPFR